MALQPPANWPPQSLDRGVAEETATLCEQLEVSGNDDPVVLAVQMAALLHMLDWHAARFLYRRYINTDKQAILEPWFQVAAAALRGQPTAVSHALQQAATSPGLGPASSTYATEIGKAYRFNAVSMWIKQGKEPPSYYASALEFTPDEWQSFLQEATSQLEKRNGQSGSTSISEVVSFLHSRMPA